MATITPTFTLAANASSHTTAGPLSIALSLSATADLSVDKVRSEIVTIGDTSGTLLIDGSTTFGGAGAGGTAGGYVYIKNTTASGTDLVYVGVEAHGDTSDLHGSGGADVKRFMTLKRDEFAWFPFDYNQDITIDATASSQEIEYWIFDRA